METIKFRKPFHKLKNSEGNPIQEAKLVFITKVPIDDVSGLVDFWKYDNDTDISYSEFYTLLLFVKPFGDMFPVFRPSHSRHGSTYEYYRKLIGETFKIEIG